MSDSECAELLKWALPRLGLRWAGFRRVRGQVCKRIQRRARELGLASLTAYRGHLEADPAEWRTLDALCRVTVSRLFRDHAVFEALGEEILPSMADAARARPGATLRAWSAGCGSGEEPYSLSIVWSLTCRERYPDLALSLLATDVDARLIARADRACYPVGALREAPTHWRDRAFDCREGECCLGDALRRAVTFRIHDVRDEPPATELDLILCRNLAFTYYDTDGQHRVAERLRDALRPEGCLIVGAGESISDDVGGLHRDPRYPWLYQRRPA